MAIVLVVDDEVSLCQMLTDILERLGYEVLSANAPDEAIRICLNRQQPIDMMLTDLSLPVMDGIQLAIHVKPLRPDIAIVLMSAAPNLDNIELNMLPPRTRLLRKPFDLVDLKDMLPAH